LIDLLNDTANVNFAWLSGGVLSAVYLYMLLIQNNRESLASVML